MKKSWNSQNYFQKLIFHKKSRLPEGAARGPSPPCYATGYGIDDLRTALERGKSLFKEVMKH